MIEELGRSGIQSFAEHPLASQLEALTVGHPQSMLCARAMQSQSALPEEAL